MIFPRSAAPNPLKNTPYSNAIVMEKNHGDGRTIAWFLPAPKASEASPAPVAICFHGNAEIIDYQDWFVQHYSAMGISLLLIEYRGYGRADGRPSQDGIVEDSLAFYNQLLERRDVDSNRIIYHGRSLGGGVAAALAAKRPPAAMILQSTFSSMASMAMRRFAPPMLLKHPFRTDITVSTADFPVLAFHGVSDDVIPIGEARKLAHIAAKHQRDFTLIEMPGDHNDFPPRSHEHALWKAVDSFLKEKGILKE